MSRGDDPRMGSVVLPLPAGATLATLAPRPDVVLLGFPYDEGTTRNGGRAGGAGGPAAVRSFLPKMGAAVNAERGVSLLGPEAPSVVDGGDVPAGLSLEAAHTALRAKVREVLSVGAIPFVVGGSNDQSSSNGLAFLDSFVPSTAPPTTPTTTTMPTAPVVVVNIDAHLDVRPRLPGGAIHSGCPFRDLLDDGRIPRGNFVEFAAQGSQCADAHARFVTEEKGGVIVWQSAFEAESVTPAAAMRQVLDKASATGNAVFFSFDIDAVTGADCPGVSCPATIGLTAAEALAMCHAAGASPAVRMVDVSELNPLVEGYRSPRLVANMLYAFLMGLATRGRAVSSGSAARAMGTPAGLAALRAWQPTTGQRLIRGKL